MGDEEATHEHQKSLAALLIFLIVAAFQCAYLWLDHLKKSGSDNEKDIQLRGEIKYLSKQASLLSQPSTFAQAAKLRRLAAAKERELAKYQNLNHKDTALYTKVLLASKYLTYGLMIIWFWRVPVAGISQQLVQPFGRFLSWKSGGVQSNDVMIGVISWLIVSARVCRFVRRAYSR
ncbi:protein GET1-like [Gastrolobium bilobum]|uniref:protein GET1-like n=1 Tax=Gastrolobium bilobum TaxID=150636 RepID=UPI002AAFE783|nr:protein GET1-like [Gastrolobium bilobum]